MDEPKNPISIPVKRPSEYTASELLDRTLEALIERPVNANVSMKKMMTSTDLHKTLFYDRENSLNLDEDEFWSILDKLEDDGFIKKENNEHNTNKVRITFKGLFFVRDGGYAHLESLKVADENRLNILNRRQAQQETAIFRLNLILAIGAFFASVYYIIETIRIFHPSWFPKP